MPSKPLNQLDKKIVPINSLVSHVSGETVDFNWNVVSGNASMLSDLPTGVQIPLCKPTLALDDFSSHDGSGSDLLKIAMEDAGVFVI